MFQVKQNESTASRKRLPILLVDLTDGYTAETGVTSPTISVSKNGAAAAAGTGSFVEIGLGQYYYEFASGEIDTLGWTAVYVIKTGTTRAYNAIVQIMAYDYAAGTNLGLSSLPTAAIGATGALLTSYTSNGALDVTATGAVNNVETVVNGVTLTAGTGSSVAQDVWNYDISGIGATNLAGGALEAAAGGTAGAGVSVNEIAQAVWYYDLSPFTPGTYPGLAGDKLNNADNYVWNYNIYALSSPGSMAGGYLIDISTWTAFVYNSWGEVAAIPDAVWVHDTTGYSENTAAYNLNTAAGLGASIAEIPNNVWSTDISGYTSPSAGYELLNAGAGVSSALSDADAAGLRYRLGLDGTATAPSATGNLGLNGGTLSSVVSVSGNVLGNINGNVNGDVQGNVNSVNSLPQGVIQTIWEYGEVGIGLTTSIGYRLKTNVDAQISAVDNNVWSYNTGTGASAAAQLNAAAVAGAGGSSALEIAQTVWGLDISSYTSPSAGYELLNAGAGSGGSSAVEIATEVWGFATKDITGGVIDTNNDKTGYSLTQAFPSNFDLLSINGSGQVVTSNPGTGSSSAVEIATAVWEADPAYHNNNSTFGKAILRSDQTNITGSVTVWSGASYNGVYADTYRIDASYDAATNLKNVLTGIGATVTANIAGSVDNVVADVNVSTASISDIVDATWTEDISGYTSPSAGYDLANVNAGSGGSSAAEIAAAVWDANVVGVGDTTSAAFYLANTLYTTGNIEAYVQNQTPQDIWSYAGVEGRTITGGTGVTLATALPSNFSTLSINGSGQVTTSNPGTGASTPAEIASAVWSAVSRTITGGTITTNSDKTGYSLTQSFPSNFSILSINGSGQVTTSNPGTGASTPTQIAQAVWQYNTGTGASAAGQLNLAAIGDSSQTATAVWDTIVTLNTYPTSNKAGHALFMAYTNTDNIPLNVWRYDSSGHIGISDSFAELMWYAASGSSSTTQNNYAKAIWNYNTGTGASAATQLNAAAIAGSGGSSAVEIASEVWAYDTGTNNNTRYVQQQAGKIWAYTQDSLNLQAITFEPQLAQITNNTSNIPLQVWSYNTGTGASSGAQLNAAAAGSGGSSAEDIAGAVWSAVSRTITGGTGVTLATALPTNFSLLSIDGSGQVVASNAGSGGSSASEIATAVWAYDISTGPASPSASYYIDNINTEAQSAAADASTAASNTNDIGGTVWQYDPTALTSPQAGAILTDIQTDTNSIITDIGNVPNNVWASDVSGYTNPGEAGYELMNAGAGSGNSTEVASAVWTYATRDITGGVIDTNNDKTGYDLNQSFPSNFSTLSINGSGEVTTSNPGTGSTASPSDIAAATWSYGSGRTITGGTGVTLATALPSNFSTLNIDGSGKVSVQAADISTIKSGLSTLTQAQVGTEVDSSLSDVGLTTVVTGRIDAAISSRLASASAPVNFSTLAINGSGEVTTSNPGTGASATQIASAVWTANRASIGASNGQFGYYLDAPVSAAGGTVTQVMLGPFALAATDGNNGYLNVFVDDERPVELVITDQNGNAIPLDTNNTHSVLVYDSGSTLVATYTGTVEYEAGGLVSFPLDADVTATAGSYKVVFDIDNGLTISKYGGLTILVRLC